MFAPDATKFDTVIRRARNGYLVFTPSEVSDSGFDVWVYEFSEDRNAEAQAFRRLLWDHFPSMFRSKHEGGLSMELFENGYAQDV